jgi:curved DNA-binding protein CbpA
MQGNLSGQSAAEVLGRVQSLRASGVLRVEDGKTIRQMFIDAGSVVRFASSNLPDESLTCLLKQKAGVTDDQLRRATAAKKQNELLGTALVRIDALPAGRLAELTREHVGQVLRAVLSLRDGRFRFQAGELPFRDQVDGGRTIAGMLLQWARETVDPQQARAALGAMETLVDRAPGASAAPPDLPLDPAEAYVMSRLDVPTSLRDLCTLSPAPEDETLKAIHALRLAGLARSVAAGRPDDRPAPRIVDARAGAASPAASPGLAAAPVATAAAVSPRRVPGNGGAPVPEPEPGAPRIERVAPLTDLEHEMTERFGQLHKQSMYEILGVETGAATPDIRRAYYAHAHRLHPDKFRREEMKAQAEKVFARITEAYSTLSREESRRLYDEDLARSTGQNRNQEHIDPAVMARLNFSRGKALYDKGKYPYALPFFANACQQDAARGVHFLYLGLTQSHNPRLRREAVENLKKAIELDPSSAEPYANLGTLYIRMGLKERGQEMYRKALQWDASNEEALRGLGGDAGDQKRGLLGIFGRK